ncbi:hypothetical protein [Marilutibacter alkalisoli]|uniref:Uncharacterized protein n=1 Tax=Marilutibacter alkalisoli TaxID=2591633 RepID=A0A514BRM4_9GAMM|nr:hypothetical protein [Lysobacter alkalisoli]QDH70033.1 hypothetical protein FKV23_07925 [Lysobacter alkalisoli]
MPVVEAEATQVDPASIGQVEAASAQPQELTRAEREAALNEIRRKSAAAAEAERAQREAFERERERKAPAGAKCIEGVLYGKQGNEWQELGTC